HFLHPALFPPTPLLESLYSKIHFHSLHVLHFLAITSPLFSTYSVPISFTKYSPPHSKISSNFKVIKNRPPFLFILIFLLVLLIPSISTDSIGGLLLSIDSDI